MSDLNLTAICLFQNGISLLWFVIYWQMYAALCITTEHNTLVRQVKRVQMHPPSASHVLLPDGRRLAYQEQGVPTKTSRISLIAPHSFLSSRLAGN